MFKKNQPITKKDKHLNPRISVGLSPELYAEVVSRSRSLGVPASSFIAFCVGEKLQQYRATDGLTSDLSKILQDRLNTITEGED